MNKKFRRRIIKFIIGIVSNFYYTFYNIFSVGDIKMQVET